jgi:hypothetical protein
VHNWETNWTQSPYLTCRIGKMRRWCAVAGGNGWTSSTETSWTQSSYLTCTVGNRLQARAASVESRGCYFGVVREGLREWVTQHSTVLHSVR